MNLASPRGRLFLSRACISKFDTSQNRKKFETPCNCAGVLLEFNTNNHNLSRILRDESGEKGNTPQGFAFFGHRFGVHRNSRIIDAVFAGRCALKRVMQRRAA